MGLFVGWLCVVVIFLIVSLFMWGGRVMWGVLKVFNEVNFS